MMYLWRLRGTDTFEFSYPGDPPGALVGRRELVEQITGEPFPPAGVCPVVSHSHEGEPDWDYLGTVETPVWEPHPFECLTALTREWQVGFDHMLEERDYRITSAKLSRHIKKGY